MAAVTTRTGAGHATGNLDAATLRLTSDYDIYHCPSERPDAQQHTARLVTVAGRPQREAQPPEFNPTLAPHPPVAYPVSNPAWWPRVYRRVPDYRPVNRELDREQRRQRPLFQAVGTFMIAGCSMIANWSSLWRSTAGKVTNLGVGRIGGEF
ncbi:hypothetical protein N7474_001961 [Penicillium riverlandense]|uniref:uncharacterized protein n=1 Tax=Penicillium riverlandense TaxID=1903569 RepID=UPI002548539A|nr:uncharacterized protein N7474_001961 [Penicillium riverlandense]KAJ5833650.1 hypothetical protein N7474_001961 [Penicillium riverlandense]